MDRAKAIKRLEDLVKIWDGDPFVQESVDAFKLAIAALREQEQREQGCEYCNGLSDAQREDFTMPNASKKDYDIVKIEFCPMCGRKLPEPPKEGAEG